MAQLDDDTGAYERKLVSLARAAPNCAAAAAPS
jgi:hypothetical protein